MLELAARHSSTEGERDRDRQLSNVENESRDLRLYTYLRKMQGMSWKWGEKAIMERWP